MSGASGVAASDCWVNGVNGSTPLAYDLCSNEAAHPSGDFRRAREPNASQRLRSMNRLET